MRGAPNDTGHGARTGLVLMYLPWQKKQLQLTDGRGLRGIIHQCAAKLGGRRPPVGMVCGTKRRMETVLDVCFPPMPVAVRAGWTMRLFPLREHLIDLRFSAC